LVLWEEKQKGKPLARLRKREESNKIINEKADITNVDTELQKIIRYNCEQLYVSKFDNLEEMYKFLDIYILVRVNHGENPNRQVTRLNLA
jgi:hypothetical protein